jgi:hypothetical protein
MESIAKHDLILQKEIGAWNKIQAFEGVEGWTMALLTRVLGWSTEKVRQHLDGVRKDYRNPAIHSYMTAYVVALHFSNFYFPDSFLYPNTC